MIPFARNFSNLLSATAAATPGAPRLRFYPAARLWGMSFEYLGTALFFLWVSFSIFRWVVRTATDIRDAPPLITELEEEVLRDAAMRSGRRLREEALARTPS